MLDCGFVNSLLSVLDCRDRRQRQQPRHWTCDAFRCVQQTLDEAALSEIRYLSERIELAESTNKIAKFFTFAPPGQRERIEAAPDLRVCFNGVPGVPRPDGDNRDPQVVGYGLDEIQGQALLASAAGQELVHFIDDQYLHSYERQRV